jgi:hypothetical protein
MRGQKIITNVLYLLVSVTGNNTTADLNLNVNILSLPRKDDEKMNAKNEA